MADKLTSEQQLQIVSFVRETQSKLASVLITQARDAGVEENTAHTEVRLKNAETGEEILYLVTTDVRVLTDELKAKITKKEI